MGKRRRKMRQPTIWVATTDLPRSAAHLFYQRLNRVLDEVGFDAFVTGRNTVQEPARAFEWDERVVKRGGLRRVRNCFDFVKLLCYTPLERWKVARIVDLIERRHGVRQSAYGEKRVHLVHKSIHRRNVRTRR